MGHSALWVISAGCWPFFWVSLQERQLCREDLLGSIVCCWGCYGDASWVDTQALTSPWEGSPVPRTLAALQVRQVGNRAHNRSCFKVGEEKQGRLAPRPQVGDGGGHEAPVTGPILP